MNKRLMALLLLALLLLSGCQRSDAPTTAELWVVTEQGLSDGMNYQAKQAAEAFQAAHEGVTVRLDILPVDEQERDIALRQLRTQIMAGKGPDVYLLPTGNTLIADIPAGSSQKYILIQSRIEPLFHDAAQSMHSGLFADISALYDADDALRKESLHPDLMAAGTVGDSRYILPLRFNMPVLLTDPKGDRRGMTQELVDGGIPALTDYAFATCNTLLGVGLELPQTLSVLPRLFDYAKGEMLITKEDLAEYLRLYQRWQEAFQPAYDQFITEHYNALRNAMEEAWHWPRTTLYDPNRDILQVLDITFTRDMFNSYLANGQYFYHWSLEELPLYSHDLTHVIDQAVIGKVYKTQLAADPLRNMAGEAVAEVTYYGAVGASCADPALAYDYLRLFLTEDYQYDLVRPRTDRSSDDTWNLARELQNDGFVENSWPVRTADSPTYLWDTLQYQTYYDDSGLPSSKNQIRKYKNRDLGVTDEDMPILSTHFDRVDFPIVQAEDESLVWALTQLNHADGTPTAVDIDALAAQLYQYLWWHMAEG